MAKENSKTRVAIIGRPNVGKSSLFNYLTGKRQAVVKDQPGVTRDLNMDEAELWDKSFEVVDTGGLTEAGDVFSQLIREQVLGFLKSTDILIVVMDARAGLMPEDKEVLRMAKQSGKPYVIMLNKADRAHELDLAKMDFYELAEELIPVSVEHRHGLSELLEWIYVHIDRHEYVTAEMPRLAIVGKPNVGKSSLINRLLGEKRVLVSDIAGTTVDAIDVEIEYDGKNYLMTDTAGMRKAAKRLDGVEVISAFKSEDAISSTDLVLLVIDVLEGPTEQDAKIVESALDDHKAIIILANKMDRAEEERDAVRSTFRAQVERNFHFFPDIPVVFISAKTGKGIKDLFATIESMREKLAMRIPTSRLNDFFMQVIRLAPAPVMGTKIVKFYYLTQTNQVPPSFIAFCNFPEAVDSAYRRFLIKRIKEEWGLQGIPIRIYAMQKGGRKL